ncbi:MAG: RnfABCDGE type electron transport complex subunit D [Deltaproteobacteria bacterium]
MADKYIVSAAPHFRKKEESVSRIMWTVNIALVPAALMSVVIFGYSSLWVMLTAVAATLATEAVIQRGPARRRRASPRVTVTSARGLGTSSAARSSVADGSAFMTGLLLAFNLPANVPLWIPFVGGVFAIAIAKQAFGGLGRNIFNPALASRAFLMAAWPQHMTAYMKPFAVDAVTQATPLMLLKEGKAAGIADMGLTYKDMLLGFRGGCLGEVCALALLLGGLYLLIRGIITWHTPVSFIAAAAVFGWALGSPDGYFKGDIVFQILSGGLLLGALFMATDYVTSPITKKGQVVFGVCCGLLTGVIRRWGGYPEGVCYSILFMNTAVPLIDRFMQPRRYGVTR